MNWNVFAVVKGEIYENGQFFLTDMKYKWMFILFGLL